MLEADKIEESAKLSYVERNLKVSITDKTKIWLA